MAVLVAALQMQQQPAEHLVKVMAAVSMAAQAHTMRLVAVAALVQQVVLQPHLLAVLVV
jgi:hypothetical protein